MSTEPTVHIRVTANVNSWRRGQEYELPLTAHVEAMEMAGYIEILGHSAPPRPVVEEPAPVPKARRKPKEAPDGSSAG